MKRLYYLLLVMAIFTMSSCGTMVKTKHRTLNPTEVRLNIDIADLEYMGQVEISVDYRTYLGFIRVTDSVNGEPYDSFNKKRFSSPHCLGGVSLAGPIRKATYKVYETFPDATYFQPVLKTKEKEHLFLGSENTTKVIIKAYKLK